MKRFIELVFIFVLGMSLVFGSAFILLMCSLFTWMGLIFLPLWVALHIFAYEKAK